MQRPEQNQLARLNHLLSQLWELNPFYSQKWRLAGIKPTALGCLEELNAFPFTTRAELLADQLAAPPFGTNLTCAPDAPKRIHRSSGTTHAPLFWADTTESWNWVRSCSEKLFVLADITASDRLLFIMPFAGFSGPWIIYEGACRLGCGCFTAGNSEPADQVRWLKDFQPTVLVGKPSALETLAVAAEAAGIPPAAAGATKLILTGEPTTKFRPLLEGQWNVPCFDRYGMTEAGSIAGECSAHSGGMHLLADDYIAELIHPVTAQPIPDNQPGELVLTTLGRWPRPIIRYRTGDQVRLVRQYECPCGRTGAFLRGEVKRGPWCNK